MKKYFAEFMGTACLVLMGCGSAVAANTLLGNAGEALPLAFSTLLIAFAFGLSIVAMAYSIGNVSGCHINPAVSLAMLLTKRMTLKDFIGYVIAQFAGGILGALLIISFMGSNESLGQNGYGSLSALNISATSAFIVEAVLTCIFVFLILFVTSKKEYSNIAGLVIGLTLTLIHIIGIPFTGTSVNPARSFGPALLLADKTALSQVWVFIVAPLVGACFAAALYFLFTNKGKSEVK